MRAKRYAFGASEKPAYEIQQALVTGNGAIEGWGGAFEIAYPISDRFVKLSNVLHLTWIVHDSEQVQIAPVCIPYFVKITYKGERMVVFVADFREGSTGDTLYAVDPVYGIDHAPSIEAPTMEYTWLANHFYFGTGARHCFSRVDYFGSDERPIVISLNGREAIFSFEENYLRRLVDEVNAASSSS